MTLWAEAIKISYHPANFARHRNCSSGDIMIIVYHVILQDHVIKGSCDFMDRSPSKSYHPAKFGVHKHSITGDMFLLCHVILM